MLAGNTKLREEVRRRYAASARGETCCDPTYDEITGHQYTSVELSSIPKGAAAASLGCGNPTAVASLQEGETVLDLGSGGGIDVILSARRVGAKGFAYGLDMTREMLELARKNADEAGVTNVEFLEGYIEKVPLDDGAVDVVISNCVINLSVDKAAVFAEIFRVLRPGGRIGITDVVADDSLSHGEIAERGSWVGCIAGALRQTEYRTGLAEAGFENISLEATHSAAPGLDSMIIRATKPV